MPGDDVMQSDDAEFLRAFQLVGSRFSKIAVNESALGGTSSEFTVVITGENAILSNHTYSDRPVIELVVGLTARTEDRPDADIAFQVECTAGFVGKDPQQDGDLAAFKRCAPFYGRSLYWMLRERVDSILAVTMMRTAKTLPWDVMNMDLPKVSTAVSSRAEAAKDGAPAPRKRKASGKSTKKRSTPTA